MITITVFNFALGDDDGPRLRDKSMRLFIGLSVANLVSTNNGLTDKAAVYLFAPG
jgi:hypothetical protein